MKLAQLRVGDARGAIFLVGMDQQLADEFIDGICRRRDGGWFDQDVELKPADSQSITGLDDPLSREPLAVQERPGFTIQVAQAHFAIAQGDHAVMEGSKGSGAILFGTRFAVSSQPLAAA